MRPLSKFTSHQELLQMTDELFNVLDVDGSANKHHHHHQPKVEKGNAVYSLPLGPNVAMWQGICLEGISLCG